MCLSTFEDFPGVLQETRVQSLAQEDLLEEEIVHSSTFAWEARGQRSLAGCGLQSMRIAGELDTI